MCEKHIDRNIFCPFSITIICLLICLLYLCHSRNIQQKKPLRPLPTISKGLQKQTIMQKYCKIHLMQLAQALRKSGFTLRDALRRAWATIKLKAQMLIKPVNFFYTKEDGTERMAVGYYGAAPVAAGSSKPGPLNVVKYFDTLAGGWRSFRADRLITD